MPITKKQLVDALSTWCINFCYEGCPEKQRAEALSMFCKGNDNPQESDIKALTANYFQNNHQTAYESLVSSLKLIGFCTDTSKAENKNYNIAQCRDWALPIYIEQIHELLYDLSQWKSDYRGSKAILNTLKIIRALSRIKQL